jgi:hypothetical protein
MSILNRIANLLETDEISVESHRNRLNIPVRCGALGSRVEVSQGHGFLQVLVRIPLSVPSLRLAAASEAVNRINWELISGLFELNMTDSDGELRFRNSFPMLDSVPTDKQLRFMVFESWRTTARYIAALVEVALGDGDPVVAIQRAEKPMPQNLIEAIEASSGTVN